MDFADINVPPFPEGSDWTEPAPEPYDLSALARCWRSASLVVLWSSVLVFVAITLGLLRADTVIYDGTNADDIGPMDGLNAFLIVVTGVAFGLLPLVLAIWNSVAVARRKQSRARRTAGFVAAYTVICGAVTTPVWIQLTAQTEKDRRIEAAAVVEATQIFWTVGSIALVPLVLFLLFLLRSTRIPR